MIDVEMVTRILLTDAAGIRAAFGNRIYAGRNLPAGYKPADGPALLFAIRGGDQDYSSKIFTPSIQIRIYGETEKIVRQSAQILYDGMNDQKNRNVLFSRMESGTFPVLLSEPESNWPYILTFFKLHIKNG